MSDESPTLHSITQTVDEETPLLTTGQDSVYDRFSKSKKRAIVAIVSFAGLVPRESLTSPALIAMVDHFRCFLCACSVRFWDFRTLNTSDIEGPWYYRVGHQVSIHPFIPSFTYLPHPCIPVMDSITT